MKKIIIAMLIAIVLIAICNAKYFLKKVYKTEYSEYVEMYATEYEIDPLLVYAIIKSESNFDEDAVSNKGACGLMQLMDETAKEVAQNTVIEYETGKTLYNPEQNIALGIAYFKDLQNYFKNDGLALAAYNAGIGNVNKWIKQGTIKADGSDLENIPYKETNMYVRKILKDYKIYKKLYLQ